MTDRPLKDQTTQQPTVDTTTPVVPPEVTPLPEVLRQIQRDSRQNPQQYLDETTVPFGGE